MKTLARSVVPLAWLRGYRPSFIPRDFAAGLAVCAMLIPQGLAFAQIVDVPPVAGLWSGIAAMLGYAVLGPDRRLMVGPEAGTAMIVAAVLTSAGISGPEDRLSSAALLSFMVAVVMLLAGLFRLGAIADFLSRPILVGYINGVALTLVVSQLPNALGVQDDEEAFFPQTLEVARALPETHLPTLWLTLGSLVTLLLFRRISRKVPAPVLVVAGAIALSALLDLEGKGIAVIGHIEQGLPSLGLPDLSLARLESLATGALSVSLLIYASTVLTGRVFADKRGEEVNANDEFFGLAASNFLCGLVNGVPAAGSDARTLINDAARAKSQAAGLFAAAATVAVIFVLAPIMRLLPNAALSAVVIASAFSLFDLKGLVRIWRIRRSEGVLALVALAGVLAFGILPGVLLAVALAVGYLVRRAANPHDAVLGRVQGRPGFRDIERQPDSEILPGLIIYRMDAPLFFANARFLREQVRKLVAQAKSEVRMVVLDCGAMFELDVTAAETLQALDKELHARGIRLGLAEPHAPMREVLRRSGLLKKIGPEDVFATVDEAIRSYVRRTEADLGDDLDWVQVDEDRPNQPVQ